MGDSMEKEKNTKKKSTSTTNKKSTGRPKTAAKKTTAKKTSSAKKGTTKQTAKTSAKKTNTTKVVKPVVVEKVETTKVKEVVEIKNSKENTKMGIFENLKNAFAKKSEKAKDDTSLETNELVKLVKIVAIVTAIFLVFYLVTYLVAKNKSDNTDKKETESVSIQYTEILLSGLLKQNSSEYYVLAYASDDAYYEGYNTYLAEYAKKTTSLNVYKAIIDNGFNSSFYDSKKDSNLNVDSIENLKLNKSTLFKIKDGKIVNFYEGTDSINSHLSTIIK